MKIKNIMLMDSNEELINPFLEEMKEYFEGSDTLKERE